MDNNIWDEPGDNPSNIMLNEKDGRLRCATLNKLIEKITSPDSHGISPYSNILYYMSNWIDMVSYILSCVNRSAHAQIVHYHLPIVHYPARTGDKAGTKI